MLQLADSVIVVQVRVTDADGSPAVAFAPSIEGDPPTIDVGRARKFGSLGEGAAWIDAHPELGPAEVVRVLLTDDRPGPPSVLGALDAVMTRAAGKLS